MLALRLTRFEHLIDLNRVGELSGIDAVERDADDRGDDPPARGRAQRRGRRGRAAPRASRPRSSVTSRSATAARSAARSRTPTPRRSSPRWRSRSTPSSRWRARRAPAASPPPTSSSARGRRAFADDELLVAAHFPVWEGRAGFAFDEVARRSGDFALAGVACAVELGGDGTMHARRHRAAGHGIGTPSAPARPRPRCSVARHRARPSSPRSRSSRSPTSTPPTTCTPPAHYRQRSARTSSNEALSAALEEASR